MAADELPGRIVIDPAVAFGKHTVRGTRISVDVIVGLLEDGMTTAELLAEYPSITDEDVRACLAFDAIVRDP